MLVAGCWLLVAGYWLLVTCYWLLVTGCWKNLQSLIVNHHSLIGGQGAKSKGQSFGFQLKIINHLSLVINFCFMPAAAVSME
jgi:hypothetical protein